MNPLTLDSGLRGIVGGGGTTALNRSILTEGGVGRAEDRGQRRQRWRAEKRVEGCKIGGTENGEMW